jgi:hypothetical protein
MSANLPNAMHHNIYIGGARSPRPSGFFIPYVMLEGLHCAQQPLNGLDNHLAVI